MLTYLHLENFRAFGEPTHIPLAPITLLFGENSAGKTSILHALALLKQSLDLGKGEDSLIARGNKSIVDLGSFGEYVFEHVENRPISIGIGFRNENTRIASMDGSRRRGHSRKPVLAGMHWRVECTRSGERPVVTAISITNGGSPRSIATFVSNPTGAASQRAQRMDFEDRPWHLESFAPTDEQVKKALEFWSVHAPVVAAACKEFYTNVLAKQKTVSEVIDSPNAKNTAEPIPLALMGVSNSINSFYDRYSAEMHRRFVLEMQSGVSEKVLIDRALVLWMNIDWRRDGIGLYPVECWPWDSYPEHSRTLMDRKSLQLAKKLELTNPMLLCGNAASGVSNFRSSYRRIGPHRAPPQRFYLHGQSEVSSVGVDGAEFSQMLRDDPSLIDRSNVWFKRLGLGYEISVDRMGKRRGPEIFEVRLRDTSRKPALSVSLGDVGYGISQIMPIVIEAVAGEGKVISVEQPELHVHPRLQAEMAELFVASMQDSAHQFLIETHSEHLILRLRRLVREGKLKPEDLCVLYVSRGKRGSVVDRIRIDERGDFLDEWPGGFFPERLNELL
jgi:predicted ATPase